MEDLVFVVPKMYRKFSYIKRNSALLMKTRKCLGKPINVWVGTLLWGNVPEVSNFGGARTKNGGFPVSCLQPAKIKFYGKPILPMEYKMLQRDAFWDLNRPAIKNPKLGNPKPDAKHRSHR